MAHNGWIAGSAGEKQTANTGVGVGLSSITCCRCEIIAQYLTCYNTQ